MSREKLKIEGGFIPWPRRLLKKALESCLSGSEWNVLAWCVLQRFDNPNNRKKRTLEGGLTALAKHVNLSRSQALRARDSLVDKGLLIQVRANERRKAAVYRLPFDCTIHATVAPMQQSEEEVPTMPSVQQHCATDATMTVAPMQHKVEVFNSCAQGTVLDTPPSPSVRGEVDCAKNAEPTPPSFPKASKPSSSLSGDSVPLPADGTPRNN